MEGKVKLPATIAEMSDGDLQKFIDAHLPGGHKRKLAEEIKRLRALLPNKAKKAA
jgi:hypothetical protein